MMSRFSSRARNVSMSSEAEIEELGRDSIVTNNEKVEDKIFIAVGTDFEANKSNLTWTLLTFAKLKIVLVHVHCPDKYISIMGGKFPIDQVSPEQVKAHRVLEQKHVHKTLDKYVLFCNSAKARTEKLVIDMDDVAKGLIELIYQHQITRLVIGAAADKHYSATMKVPRSKTATIVNKEAPLSCEMYFVCKGALICTRQSIQQINSRTQSPNASPSSSKRSSRSETSQVKSTAQPMLTNPVQNLIKKMLKSSSRGSSTPSSPGTKSSHIPDPWQGIPKNSRESYPSSWSGGDDVTSIMGSSMMLKDDDSQDGSVATYFVQNDIRGSMMPYSVQEELSQELHLLSTDDRQDNLDDEMYNKLCQIMEEADHLKHQAYEESRKRSVAEREAMEAKQRVKTLEIKCDQRIKEGEELQESITQLKMELENLKIEHDETHEKLKSALELKLQLEMQIDSYSSSVMDLEEKLSSAYEELDSMRSERDTMRQERDDAIEAAEELQRKKDLGDHAQALSNFLEFPFSELEIATQNFEASHKIGEGGYGSVYKGFLRHTTVAIKVLRPQSSQGESEFLQEVEILSKMRHPNLVTLIGACSEKRALVYEYLPYGSLEDHLALVNYTSPLSWQTRVRIAAEICSALIFLHSSKPQSVVHGDLKPGNILLDGNLTSKLSDFGISRLLTESGTTHTHYCQTGPKGTLVYMDPEFLITGELTIQSDVYSFGVVLLRLLTGKPPFGIVREVKVALSKGMLQNILDPTAGDWPFVQAQQLAEIGLRCCEMNRKQRPDLVREVWKVIAPMMRPLLQSAPSFSIGPTAEDNSHIPSYFICPIFQEIMRDPLVASDGYTYEAEAIRGWLENRNTSPMTNLELPNNLLFPNLALRSSIKEYLQQHDRT